MANPLRAPVLAGLWGMLGSCGLPAESDGPLPPEVLAHYGIDADDELSELRTRRSSTWRLPDGQLLSVLTLRDHSFQADDGTWRDIDTAVLPKHSSSLLPAPRLTSDGCIPVAATSAHSAVSLTGSRDRLKQAASGENNVAGQGPGGPVPPRLLPLARC